MQLEFTRIGIRIYIAPGILRVGTYTGTLINQLSKRLLIVTAICIVANKGVGGGDSRIYQHHTPVAARQPGIGQSSEGIEPGSFACTEQAIAATHGETRPRGAKCLFVNEGIRTNGVDGIGNRPFVKTS